MVLGERLELARKAIGYKQPEASAKSGIGVSSISEFEHSKREPSFSQLSRLAEVYKKPLDFFFSDSLPVENIMLWRDAPKDEQERKETEAKFRLLCQQYLRLELCTGEVRQTNLPKPENVIPEKFSYRQAESFAKEVQKKLSLGDIPAASIKQILEEKYYIKIFHLDIHGSAISIKSDEFGMAILLNKKSKSWRRNFDLAHELFHLLTWEVFRSDSPDIQPSEYEEKLANTFASRLLLPTDVVKDRIDAVIEKEGGLSINILDEIAREFQVSLKALLWRLISLYNKPREAIEEYIDKAEKTQRIRPPRKSDGPDELPERYCSLAIKALRIGNLSLMQFAKYMGISYKKAQEYVTEDGDFTDEKISISVA